MPVKGKKSRQIVDISRDTAPSVQSYTVMSARLLPYLPRNSHKFYSVNAIPHTGTFASTSKDTLDKSPRYLTRSEPSLITFDAPSQPSERTRRSARSTSSLTDYHSARHRLGGSSAGQVRASTSSSSNAAGSTAPNPPSQSSTPKAQIFDRPSRPREYYSRPQRKQDLPELKVCKICDIFYYPWLKIIGSRALLSLLH